MVRWLTSLLYALMLACASLPASAGWQVMAHADAGAAHADQPASTAVPAVTLLAADGLLGGELPSEDLAAGDEDERSLEFSELFFGARPLALLEPGASAPPRLHEPLAPPPFLDGPQRPPRALPALAA